MGSSPIKSISNFLKKPTNWACQSAQGRYYPDGASLPYRGGAIPLIEGKKGELPRP